MHIWGRVRWQREVLDNGDAHFGPGAKARVWSRGTTDVVAWQRVVAAARMLSRHVRDDVRRARIDAIYREDEGRELRKSHENPAVAKLYEEFLGEPLGGGLANTRGRPGYYGDLPIQSHINLTFCYLLLATRHLLA